MTSLKTTHLSYRPDIDGLRAIAVIPVVIFHAFPDSIPGGFTGVDIFFVISGFLISSIILIELQLQQFSIGRFYDRRIRRIFPALITVLLTTLVFGWFYLLSDEYRQLGKHIAGGASFVSNILLWGESGYFDKSAETKPLLHLWSLAIEEQFYVVWPVFLAISWRLKWNALKITALIAALSFSINIYLSHRNPSAAFYFPISRFWELMLGGMLAHVVLHQKEWNSRYRDEKSLAGAAMLFAGFVLLDGSKQFPGFWALLPAVGTVLVISAGPEGWFNRNVLATRPLIWIGAISYPLYLWHWPLLVFARLRHEGSHWTVMIAMVTASLLCAWMTFLFIEQPLKRWAPQKLSLKLLACFVPIGLLGYGLMWMNGMPGWGYRTPDKVAYTTYFENAAPNWNYFTRERTLEKFNERCNFYDLDRYLKSAATRTPRPTLARPCYERSGNSGKAVLLWGDSHATHFAWGLTQNLPAGWQLLQVASSSCPVRLGAARSKTDYCEQSNWFAVETIKTAKPDAVIIGQNNGHDIEAMRKIAKELTSLGVPRVIFAGPSPHWEIDLPKIVLREFWPDTPTKTSVRLNTQVLKSDAILKEQAKPAKFEYVSVTDHFCDSSGCSIYLGGDRRNGITSVDYGHLSAVASDDFGKEVLVPMLLKQPPWSSDMIGREAGTLQRIP